MTKSRILKSNPYKDTILSSIVIHALASGKGVTWLDKVRIPYQSDDDRDEACRESRGDQSKGFGTGNWGRRISKKGRFPANLLVSDDILNDGRITKSIGGITKGGMVKRTNKVYGVFDKDIWTECPNDSGSYSRYFDLDKWWITLLERIEHENPDL